jgi:uncharacterized protein YbjQ (UPF0145 family)
VGGAIGGAQPSRWRESIERMVDRAKAHGVNVAICFRLDSNNIGNYNHAHGMTAFIEPKSDGEKHTMGLNSR